MGSPKKKKHESENNLLGLLHSTAACAARTIATGLAAPHLGANNWWVACSDNKWGAQAGVKASGVDQEAIAAAEVTLMQLPTRV